MIGRQQRTGSSQATGGDRTMTDHDQRPESETEPDAIEDLDVDAEAAEDVNGGGLIVTKHFDKATPTIFTDASSSSGTPPAPSH
jgi:hypothetical protein